MRLRINVITLFPDFFSSPLQSSLIGKACKKKILNIDLYNLRDFAVNEYGKVDDSPYGGGAGMVFMIEPIDQAITCIKAKEKTHIVLLTPRGKHFTQKAVYRLQEKIPEHSLTLICGHYEGVDQRIADEIADESFSVGDYVLSSGEIAAFILIDCMARLIPGFMGNKLSTQIESFYEENYIEYPQYTRPAKYKGIKVPDILLSGNHESIKKWRDANSCKRDAR